MLLSLFLKILNDFFPLLTVPTKYLLQYVQEVLSVFVLSKYYELDETSWT